MEAPFLWIIFGLASAIMCSMIAASKNYSVSSWFVGGLLFGPLALLTIGLMAKQEVS